MVRETKRGMLLLEPVRTIKSVPEDEAWLWENTAALKLVFKGIEESKGGKGAPIGSLSDFADVDPDE